MRRGGGRRGGLEEAIPRQVVKRRLKLEKGWAGKGGGSEDGTGCCWGRAEGGEIRTAVLISQLPRSDTNK